MLQDRLGLTGKAETWLGRYLRLTVGAKFRISRQCHLVAQKLNYVLGGFRRPGEVVIPSAWHWRGCTSNKGVQLWSPLPSSRGNCGNWKRRTLDASEMLKQFEDRVLKGFEGLAGSRTI